LNGFSLQQQHEFSIGHGRRGTGIAKGVCEDLSDRLEDEPLVLLSAKGADAELR
jgi:hypothetical protein